MEIENLLPQHKCGLYIEHNAHRDYYEPLQEKVAELLHDEEISPKEADEILTSDSLWSIQWYPNTPVGFYKVYGCSLSSALEKAKQAIGEK